MNTKGSKIVLRFADSSDFPQQFVALDKASGGYPHAVTDPTRAEFWATEEGALSYAKSFDGDSPTYAAYAIEQAVHIMTFEVTPKKTEV